MGYRKGARWRPTSSVYSCTFALRCARRLIMAATTSFVLQIRRDHQPWFLQTTSKQYDYSYPESLPWTLSQTSWESRKPPNSNSSSTAHTRIYSQFSDVKFSSVALAAGNNQSNCPRSYSRVKPHQQHRRTRSAELGTWSIDVLGCVSSKVTSGKGRTL